MRPPTPTWPRRTCARVLGTGARRGLAHRAQPVPRRGRSAELAARACFGSAPIEGLRPLISEPVFFRGGLSAFANPAFATELRRARGDEVCLIGFSLADTGLATALAGVDAGLSLTIVDDAVGASDAVDAAYVARTILQPFVRICSSHRLLARRLEVAH